MPYVNTRADALHLLHTGAASVGAAQTDPDSCLGGNRASTRDRGLGFLVSPSIFNARIDYASPYNGTGSGTLTAATASTLTWTPPSGSAGDAVTLANGDQRVIEASGDPSKYVIVTRTTADDLEGTATVKLVDVMFNAVGMLAVTGAQASAGRTTYRALVIWNASSAAIENVKMWLQSATSYRIAQEALVSGAIQSIANETTAPTGVTWNSGTTSGTGLDIGSIGSSSGVGLWIERAIGAGASHSVSTLAQLRLSFNAIAA